jgi:hypothetical protein
MVPNIYFFYLVQIVILYLNRANHPFRTFSSVLVLDYYYKLSTVVLSYVISIKHTALLLRVTSKPFYFNHPRDTRYPRIVQGGAILHDVQYVSGDNGFHDFQEQ